jgi:ribosome-associated translation inhibitor RaiA
MTTTMELGGNIVLTGFADLDFTELIVVKKIVGQYARKIADRPPGFSRLNVVLHRKPSHSEIEVHMDTEGRTLSSHAEGHNLFVVLDQGFKKLETQIEK